MEKLTIEKIYRIAEKIGEMIERGKPPLIKYPPASTSNIEFSEHEGYKFTPRQWSKILGSHIKSVRTLAGVVFALERCLDHMRSGLTMTKRDFYYLHKVEKFRGTLFPSDQRETDSRIVLLELITGLSREMLSITSDPRGEVYGDITLVDKSGNTIKLNKVGEMGYAIPPNPEHIKFKEINVKALLAVEKVGPAKNMIELGIPDEYNIAVAMLHGQPSRSMRRFLRMLSDKGIPIAVLVDLSPWSIRIASTVIYNSIHSAHIPGLATPTAKFIGIHSSDVEEGGFFEKVSRVALEPLTEEDLKCAKDNLSIPSLMGETWVRENKWFLEKKKKAELEIFKAMIRKSTELKDLYIRYLNMKLEEHLNLSLKE